MFSFIPEYLYTAVYYNTMLFLALVIGLYMFTAEIKDKGSRQGLNVLGFVFLVLLILYMGLRPVSLQFGDMGAYAGYFIQAQQGNRPPIKSDYIFNWFLQFTANFTTPAGFFLIIDILYIVPCYLFAKKYSGSFWFFTFFMMVGSFSFWSYGTNGIRNGWATAMFILALVFYDRKIIMYALLALSYGIHNSMMIPIAAVVTSGFYKNPRLYLWIWLAAIPLSLVAGGPVQSLLGGLVDDGRANSYLGGTAANEDGMGAGGVFRWDFVIYSASAAYAGYWYIFKRKIIDKFYIHLYGTYMIANAFWIMVIRANFSNRFAYLSWFLMAAVIAYPIFRYRIWDSQYRAASIIVITYFGFTYFMFLIS